MQPKKSPCIWVCGARTLQMLQSGCGGLGTIVSLFSIPRLHRPNGICWCPILKAWTPVCLDFRVCLNPSGSLSNPPHSGNDFTFPPLNILGLHLIGPIVFRDTSLEIRVWQRDVGKMSFEKLWCYSSGTDSYLALSLRVWFSLTSSGYSAYPSCSAPHSQGARSRKFFCLPFIFSSWLKAWLSVTHTLFS